MSSGSESGSVYSDSEPFQSGQRRSPTYQPRDRGTTESDDATIQHRASSKQQQASSSTQPLNAISMRPNKYHGPPSTWRHHNAPERDLAASLDQLTAQDLSVHLFNAHKLKQSGLQQRAEGVDPDDPFAFTWTPPKSWTAWPMPPDVVPREDGERHDQKLVRMPYPYLPKPVRRAGLLQDLLLAQMLREAKVRLGQREWVDESIQDHQILKPRKPSMQGASDVDGQTSTVWEDSDSDGTAAGGRRRKMPKLAKSAARNASPGEILVAPVMLADDSTARAIAQPLIRSVSSRLDALLGNLHRARQSYHSIEVEGATTSRSRSTKRDRDRSATPAPGPSMVEDPLSSSAEEHNDPNAHPNSAQRRRQSSQRQRFQLRKKYLNLRDWNDVISLASSSGIPLEVIETSKQRCERLFGAPSRRGAHIDPEETASGDDKSTSSGFSTGPSEAGSGLQSVAKYGQVASDASSDNFLQPIKGKRSWRHRSRKRFHGS